MDFYGFMEFNFEVDFFSPIFSTEGALRRPRTYDIQSHPIYSIQHIALKEASEVGNYRYHRFE